MTAEQLLWDTRSIIKERMIDLGQIDLSGGYLNAVVGLPEDAVWFEDNFGEGA